MPRWFVDILDLFFVCDKKNFSTFQAIHTLPLPSLILPMLPSRSSAALLLRQFPALSRSVASTSSTTAPDLFSALKEITPKVRPLPPSPSL